MAVARVSPKIRNAIRSVRNQAFLGITSCRVYDRFISNAATNAKSMAIIKQNVLNLLAVHIVGVVMSLLYVI